MSREIKFRVWNNNEVIFHHLEFTDTGILSEDDPLTQGRVVYQQYTGLKDKNGKEIYEGDILGYPENRNDETMVEIRWAEAYSGEQWCEFELRDYKGQYIPGGKLSDLYGGGHPEYRVVVGNIFEGVDK